MLPLDLALIIILALFALYGFVFGFIHALGTLVGVLLGAFSAGRLFAPIAASMLPIFGGNSNLARVIVFLVLFVIGNRIVGVTFSLLERTFELLRIIPLVTTANRLVGAIFGLLEGSLVVGGALLIATKFPLSDAFSAALAGSRVTAVLLTAAQLITPLLPELVRKLQGTVFPVGLVQ